MDELLLIGQILGPFGVRGQVKVKAFTDRPDHIARQVRTIFTGPGRPPLTLRRLTEHKPGLLIATFEGITTREAAEELRGEELYIRAVDAAPLASDEYFLHDLVGLAVSTTAGEAVGSVREVLETGAGEVLVVARAGQPDALVPMVRDFIAELDIPGRRVVIIPIEGLL
ncbi:MAG: ribosome maturation factor RimM [Chloroflexi bacterium OHK40]